MKEIELKPFIFVLKIPFIPFIPVYLLLGFKVLFRDDVQSGIPQQRTGDAHT